MKSTNFIKIVFTILFSAIFIFNCARVYGESLQSKFSDLDSNHWAFENIMEMVRADIIIGYPDGSFRPDAVVTYGEFIKMATIAADFGSLPAKVGEHWALPYYNTGLNNFLFNEFDIEKRVLDKPITRGHMALITSSVLKYSKEYGDHSALLASIEDVDHRTPYEVEIVRAYGLRILSGYPDGSFRPHGKLTRAEAATVIARLGARLETEQGNAVQDLEEPKNAEQWNGEQENTGPELTGEWNLAEEQVPLIDTKIFDNSVPEGTFMMRMENLDGDMREEQMQLRELLLQSFPAEGEAIYNAFDQFTKMDSGGKTLGICKQYVMDYPILFNLLGVGYDIRIYPKDYSDEYWETKPGQVNVFFI